MRPPRLQQLSIYLLKQQVQDIADAIRDGTPQQEVELPPELQDGMRLLIRPTTSHPPNWLRYLPSATQEDLSGLFTASAGGVLLVWVRGRVFAVCFGTGWHMLQRDAYVRSFGLRTALSLVVQDTLKSVDIAAYENFAKYRRVSTSRGTTLDSFDIQGQLDLLQGVVGDCASPGVGEQIGGKDSVLLWTRVEIPRLSKLCGVLLRAHESKRVEKRFPLLGNVTLVLDPADTAYLDSLLDEAMAGDPRHDVSIAPPDVVNWHDIAGFVIGRGRDAAATLDLRFESVREMLAPDAPTLSRLRHLELSTVQPDGSPGSQKWSLYDCLVTELDDPRRPGYRCALMAGQWRIVAAGVVKEVEQALATLPAHTARPLPPVHPSEKEREYNLRFAAVEPSVLELLDARCVTYGAANSRVEVCDVVSSGRHLYHIKDYHGSATLSHLFAQGTVSARLLLEQDFRAKVRQQFGPVAQAAFPPDALSAGDFEVVFGVICEPSRQIPQGLPFFSKVKLVEAVRELRRMGFHNVTTARIERQHQQ